MFDDLKALLRIADRRRIPESRLAEMLTIYVSLAPARLPPRMPRPFVRARVRLTPGVTS